MKRTHYCCHVEMGQPHAADCPRDPQTEPPGLVESVRRDYPATHVLTDAEILESFRDA